MPGTIDPALLTRAFRARDANALEDCCRKAPEITLLHLDGSMRGLRDGELPPDQTRWLVDQDEKLRRRIGWTQRLADLQILRAAYHGGDVYLVVGAGVSMAAGMPDWKHLVLEVLDHAIEYGTPAYRQRVEANLRRSITGDESAIDWEVNRVLKDVKPADPSLRRRMENVRDRMRSMASYDSKVLLDASQVAGEHFGSDYLARLRNILYTRTLKRTGIHPAIARMVRVKERPWPPTPRIFSVLTYNFDDLLEQSVREAGFGFAVHCSQRGTMVWNRGETGRRPSALDIYHLHGIAPGGWILDLDGVDLVFTAEQYTVQYGEERNFARSVQHNFFRNAPGLILGSSLTDEYAVRELKTAHRDRPGWFNFAVLQLPEQYRDGPPPDPDTLQRLGASYREMGLHVLWVTNHDETPALLDFIRGEDLVVR